MPHVRSQSEDCRLSRRVRWQDKDNGQDTGPTATYYVNNSKALPALPPHPRVSPTSSKEKLARPSGGIVGILVRRSGELSGGCQFASPRATPDKTVLLRQHEHQCCAHQRAKSHTHIAHVAHMPHIPHSTYSTHWTHSTHPAGVGAGAASLSPSPSPSPSLSLGLHRRRSSHKVHQLLGHDIDVMEGHSNRLSHASTDSSTLSIDSLSSSSLGHGLDCWTASGEGQSLLLRRRGMVAAEDCSTNGMALMPLLELEADMDGASLSSSWAPSSPLSAHVAPLNVPKPVIRHVNSSKFSDSCSPLIRTPTPLLHDDDFAISSRWDPAYGHFTDTKAAGEYHQFATELAAATITSTTRSASTDTDRPAMDTSDLSPKGRASALLGFSRDARFSLRHKRPLSIDASFLRFGFGGSSSSSSSGAQRTPPLHEPRPSLLSQSGPEPAFVPRSAFDSDSDDEEPLTRMLWRKERMSHGSEKRSSAEWPVTSQSPPLVMRRPDETRRSRAWSRTGDQMKELLASARDKARMLPTPSSTTKAERRREQLRKDIRVMLESEGHS